MSSDQRDYRDQTGDLSHWGNNPEAETLNQTKIVNNDSPNTKRFVQNMSPMQKQQNQSSNSFTHKSALLDLVGDNVRNRYLTVCGFLLAYIYIVFTILAVIEDEPLMISEIKTKITLADIYKISTRFQNQSVYPRLQLKASNLQESSRYPPLDITIFVQDFIYDQVSDASRDCSYSSRMLSAGTLEYFRLYEICRVVLQGYIAPTNKNGEALFQNFTVLRGPQGRYQFAYKTIDPFTQNTVINPGFVTYFESEVAQMRLLNYPNNTVEVIQQGKPLATQPVVQLFDMKSQPVKGKRVIAFTWGEPDLSQKIFGFNYDPFRDKFALLSGYLSEESDDQGVAYFKNLTIEAYSGYSFYLYFSCENVVLKGFGFGQLDIYKQYGMMNYQFNFMGLNFLNIEVRILGNYSKVVTEGSVFDKPITLQIFDKKKKKPIAGQIIIITISDVKGQAFVKGYQGHGVGFRGKKIIKPITANYSKDFMDPFAQKDPIVSYLRTNSSGMIVLNQMFFSVYGNQDSYKLEFWANGASTKSDWIKVISTVKKVVILSQPENLIDSNLNDTLTISITVQLRNKTRGGVPGKQATISLINPKTNKAFNPRTQLTGILQKSPDGYSNQDGILTLNVLITFTTKLQTKFMVKIQVDGAYAISDEVTVRIKYPKSYLCGSLFFTKYPKSVQIGEKYNFTAKVLNQNGNPLSKQYVILYAGIDYNDGPLFPKDFIPKIIDVNNIYPTHLIAEQTNDQGVAQFTNVVFLNGQTGKINIFASTASIDMLYNVTNFFITSKGLNISELLQKVYETYLILELSPKKYFNQTYYLIQNEINSIVETEVRSAIDSTFVETYQALQNLGEEDEGQSPFEQVKVKDVIASMLNLCSYCEAPKLVVEFKNPISLLFIVYPESPPQVQKDQDNLVTLLILGDSLKPLAQTEVQPKITILKSPNANFYRYMYQDIGNQLFNVTSSGKTDDNGLLNITVRYQVNDVGLYMAVFEIYSLTSIAFPLFALHDCTKISLLSQPDSNEGSPVAMGDFMSGFKVKAFNKEGKVIQDLPIYFVIDTETKGINVFLCIDSNYTIGYSELGSIYGDQTLITMYQYRLNSTNQKGIAYFDKVTAALVGSQNTCVRFRFQTGDNIFGNAPLFPEIKSEPSNLFCFYNNLEFTILNQNNLDLQISPKGVFRNSPQILVAISKLSDCQRELSSLYGGILVTAQFYELLNAQSESQISYQTDSKFLSNYYLQNWYCSQVFGQFSPCSITNVTFDPEITDGYQAMTVYTFSSLNWKINQEAQFQLSFSDSVSNNNKTEIDAKISQIISNLNIIDVESIKGIVENLLQNSSTSLEDAQYQIFEKTINQTIEKVEYIKSQFINLLKDDIEFWNRFKELDRNEQLAAIIDKANEVDPVFMLSISSEFTTVGKLLTTAKGQVSALFGNPSSKETSMITVNYNPTQIIIEKQPPQIVYVQDVFTLIVQVKAQDFPISDTTVKVGLSKPSTTTSGMSTIDIIQMLGDLATGGGGISSMQSFMAIGSGAEFDPDRISVRTDSQGRATFNLRFIKGMNSFYKIGTECLGTSGDNTNQFQIKNHIVSVKLQDDLQQVLGKDMVNTKQYTKFNNDIVLDIEYEDDYTDDPTYPKTIEILFFVYSNLEDLEANFSNSTSGSLTTGVSNAQSNLSKLNNTFSQVDFTNQSDVSDQARSVQQIVMNQMSGDMFSSSSDVMTSLKRVIMTGGQLFLSKKQAQLNINYKIGRTLEVEYDDETNSKIKTKLIIRGLKAHFQQLGVYQIIVSIDGIQSQVSGPITVMRMANIADSSVISPIIGGLILAICFMIVYVNFFQTEETSTIQRIYNSLVFQNIEIYSDNHQRILDEKHTQKNTQVYVGLQNKSKRKRMIICTIFGLVCTIVALILTAVSQAQNEQQTGDNSFNIRNFFYYISFVSLLPLGIDIILSKFQSKSSGKMTSTSPFVDVKYYSAALYLKKLYKNTLNRPQSLKDRIILVFKPLFYHNEEFIFFPQKLLTSSIVSLFSVAYIIYQLSLFIEKVCLNLEKQTLVLQDGYSNFIATAINQIKQSLKFTLIFEEEFNKFYEPIYTLTDMILNLITAVKIAFILSLILSFLTYAFNQIMILYNFRQRVIRLRRGDYEWDENPAKLSLTTTAAFIGAHISYCVIGMGLTLVILTLGLTPLFYKYTWILAWELKLYVITIIISPIIQAILKTIVFSKLIYKGDGVRTKFTLFNRALHSCVEIIFLYTSIAAGIISAIARALVMMGVIIFNSSVTYMSIYPFWISKIAVSLDAVVHSYLATVRMHNLHNNPILLYFSGSLMNQQKAPDTFKQSKKHKLIRNKFWVATLLQKNEGLRKYRKIKKAKTTDEEKIIPLII